jgi:hypothetical protein
VGEISLAAAEKGARLLPEMKPSRHLPAHWWVLLCGLRVWTNKLSDQPRIATPEAGVQLQLTQLLQLLFCHTQGQQDAAAITVSTTCSHQLQAVIAHKPAFAICAGGSGVQWPAAGSASGATTLHTVVWLACGSATLARYALVAATAAQTRCCAGLSAVGAAAAAE